MLEPTNPAEFRANAELLIKEGAFPEMKISELLDALDELVRVIELNERPAPCQILFGQMILKVMVDRIKIDAIFAEQSAYVKHMIDAGIIHA